MGIRQELRHTVEEIAADQFTGCLGAGDYRRWAEAQGYDYLEVVDWTFIVSRDQEHWYLMNQSNNYPRAGFTRSIDQEQCFYGSGEEVLDLISEYY